MVYLRYCFGYQVADSIEKSSFRARSSFHGVICGKQQFWSPGKIWYEMLKTNLDSVTGQHLEESRNNNNQQDQLPNNF